MNPPTDGNELKPCKYMINDDVEYRIKSMRERMEATMTGLMKEWNVDLDEILKLHDELARRSVTEKPTSEQSSAVQETTKLPLTEEQLNDFSSDLEKDGVGITYCNTKNLITQSRAALHLQGRIAELEAKIAKRDKILSFVTCPKCGNPNSDCPMTWPDVESCLNPRMKV